MSVLVTGGAGFIGSHLVEHLRQGTWGPLVVLDNFNTDYDSSFKRRNVARWLDDPQITAVEGDYGDGALVRQLLAEHDVTHVVHLGGSPGVRESVADPARYFQNNINHTLTLLEEIRRRPVQRFLYASSSTVYGRGAPAPFVEDGPLGVPLSPYGASKRGAEILCQTYHGLHGIPVVILRLFNVYGPRLRPELALSIFTQAIVRGEKLPLFGDGSVRRDFANVRDVVAGMAAALSAENVAGEAINLGNNNPVTIARVIELVEQAAGKKAIIDYHPARQEEMPLTFADISKAKRLLGFEPQVSIEAGIAEFVAWWQESHFQR